jgi:hypothetical protein
MRFGVSYQKTNTEAKMQPHFEHQLEAARRLYNNDTYMRCTKKLIIFFEPFRCACPRLSFLSV